MTPILGIVTIGQTPRPDLAGAFSAEAPYAEVRVVGALDGIRAEDLVALLLASFVRDASAHHRQPNRSLQQRLRLG